MQSPCKLVFTEVLLAAVPRKHMYSHTCIQLDADWAIWLKPELIAGEKDAHLCMCALSLLHTGITCGLSSRTCSELCDGLHIVVDPSIPIADTGYQP